MAFTRQDMLELKQELDEEALEIMKRKNHDYTGDNTTPFANFQACEDFGVCSVGEGFMVRIMDKMKRIRTFIKKDELKVENESLKDAILDIKNYLDLFYGYIVAEENDDVTSQSGNGTAELTGHDTNNLLRMMETGYFEVEIRDDHLAIQPIEEELPEVETVVISKTESIPEELQE